jgi:hypothetical protein
MMIDAHLSTFAVNNANSKVKVKQWLPEQTEPEYSGGTAWSVFL